MGNLMCSPRTSNHNLKILKLSELLASHPCGSFWSHFPAADCKRSKPLMIRGRMFGSMSTAAKIDIRVNGDIGRGEG